MEMEKIISAINAIDGISVSAWKDRYYVNFAAARGSAANSDLRSKVWIKDGVMTYDRGKGYHSDAWLASYAKLEQAAKENGVKIIER